MLGFLGLALLMVVLFGGVPLGLVIYSRSVLKAERRKAATRAAPPQLAELRPTELALLVDGPSRAAEVAVMDLYLCGHLRPTGGRGELAIPEFSSLRTSDPVAGELLEAFEYRWVTSAGELVGYAADVGVMDSVRADLVTAGLLMDSRRLRRTRRLQAHTKSALGPVTALALGAVAVGAITLAGSLWFGGTLIILTSLTTVALTTTAGTVLARTGGPDLSATTPAGAEAVAEAKRRYGFAGDQHSTGQLTREEALFSTAVTGFRTMRRAHTAHGAVGKRGPERRRGSAAVIVPSEEPSGSTSGTGEETHYYDTGSLYEIVHFFQEPSGWSAVGGAGDGGGDGGGGGGDGGGGG